MPTDLPGRPGAAPATKAASPSQQVDAEAMLARLREQVAVVRSIADQVERLALAARTYGLTEQLVEEMARLGWRLFEVGSRVARTAEAGEGEVVALASPAGTLDAPTY
jgi:hypothetical protein